MSTTALLWDPAYRDHDTGAGHLECPERLDAIGAALRAAALTERLAPRSPRRATDEELLVCHTAEYLRLVEREVAAGLRCLSTGDTEIGPRSDEIARLAAGGVLDVTDAVCTGQVRNAFCAVRPPGHHACPDRGMGFCVYNNAALAARRAQRSHGIERVAIVDWDVHHGNGTQEIFWADGTVFYFSVHQRGIYPGTGHPDETGVGAGRGTTMNRPQLAGAGHDAILPLFADELAPALRAFCPGLLIISAGFDSRVGDPLGGLALTDDDFAALTSILLQVAQETAGGRVLSVLEGGYGLAGLASACAAHVGALLAG